MLQALNRQPVSTLDVLHVQTRIPKSTLVRLLQTFESEGMVSKTYKAAPATLALRLNFGPDELLNAERLNRDLGKKSGEAVPLDGGGREIKLTPDSLNDAMNAGSAVKKLDK